jgi:tetratricopeptide (TPR) repeat protein
MQEFSLEARPSRPLLLASITESLASTKPRKLQLPLLDAGFQAGLKRLHTGQLRGKPCEAPESPSDRQIRSHGLRGPNLGAAGAQLQHAAAVAGSVLVAAISQAAQRIASARLGRGSQNMPFHQSFKLPWKGAARSGSRRATREAAALAKALSARGHEYERALDVRAAVQCFEEACRLVPDSAAYLSMAAKCWSDLTFYYDVRSDRERQLVNLKAIEFAEKCIETHPNLSYGHVAMCVSKGRLALFTDNRTKVRLAKEAQQCAYAAIAADPGSDVAHHLMGRWHYEMAQINGLLRALVRIMYGTALAPGTRQDALASFRRAVELAPGRLIHRVEAGRVHLELGQVAEGVEQLEAALECEVEDINAWHTRMDAEKLLAQVRRQPWKQPSLVPPHAQQQERERGGAGGAPAASMSTAALLSGHRQPEIVSEALLSASAASAPPPAPAA